MSQSLNEIINNKLVQEIVGTAGLLAIGTCFTLYHAPDYSPTVDSDDRAYEIVDDTMTDLGMSKSISDITINREGEYISAYTQCDNAGEYTIIIKEDATEDDLRREVFNIGDRRDPCGPIRLGDAVIDRLQQNWYLLFLEQDTAKTDKVAELR